MGKITKQELHSSVNEELDKIGVLTEDLGDKSTLLTANKDNIVDSVNEIFTDVSAIKNLHQLTDGENVKVWSDFGETWQAQQFSLDNLKETGFYFAFDNYHGTTNDHKFPVGDNNKFIIQVMKTEPTGGLIGQVYIEQIAYGLNPSSSISNYGNTYKRTSDHTGNFTNSTWKKVGDIPNFEPLIDLVTIYVDGTLGTDANGYGKTSGSGAYKTLTYAFNQLPWFRGGKVMIEIANGTYGYSNIGRYHHHHPYEIIINGQSVDGVILTGIGLPKAKKVSVQNMTINGQIGFDDNNVLFSNIKNNGGLSITNSFVAVINSNISNVTSNNAIGAYSNSIVFLDTVTGTNNSCGIYSDGSVVRKKNTTITGTTPQVVVNGGQIL